MHPNECPICKNLDGQPAKIRTVPSYDHYQVDCEACGSFQISRTAAKDARLDAEARRALSNVVRWKCELAGGSTVHIDSTQIEQFERAEVPAVNDQIDNCIRYLAHRLRYLGREYDNTDPALISAIGAIDAEGAVALIEQLNERGDLKALFLGEDNAAAIKLTLQGWALARELEQGSVGGSFGFMAMQYGDTLLERVVAEIFRPCAAEAGFDLEVLRDRPQAGVIDNYLRSRLKLCRFVIADLTHSNNGAYWESGYAEGLGKPVIYTCRSDVFEEKKTHFDTNHCQTIVWHETAMDEAKNQLLACIRNSIPEAK